jgi:hypothetical protein
MVKKNSAKILSILVGIIGGLVVIFLILASLFPDLNFPTLKVLLSDINSEQINSEEILNNEEFAEESLAQIPEEAKLIALTASEDDTQAWDLLINNHQIIYQEYDFGIFLEGIDGLKGDQHNFWAIYVNGEKSDIGISDIILNDGDIIEFKYEAIEESFN